MESVPDDAKQMAIAVDRQILGSYRLFPVHYLAYRLWDEQDRKSKVPSAAELFSREEIRRAEAEWSKRLAACPSVQQPYLIQQYATPVRNQYRLLAGLGPEQSAQSIRGAMDRPRASASPPAPKR